MPKSRPLTPKLAFASDNASGMSPSACSMLMEAQAKKTHAPYGRDEFTEKATDLIRGVFELPSLPVFYMPTGTASNVQTLAAICSPGSAILAARTAHILTDERGAPHAATGNAVFPISSSQGLMDLEEVPAYFKRSDPHYSNPEVVYISQATELGTVYRPEHHVVLRELKRKFKFKVVMDGARFGNAVASLKARPKDLSWLQDIDVLVFGLSKGGGGLSEAVVYFSEELGEKFGARQKQSGNLVAKSWILTAPIVGLLRDGEYFRNAEHANAMARRLADGIKGLYAELDGEDEIIAYPVEANAVFAKFSPTVLNGLRNRGWSIADFIGGCPRLMTNWATTQADIDELLHDLRETLNEDLDGTAGSSRGPRLPALPARC